MFLPRADFSSSSGCAVLSEVDCACDANARAWPDGGSGKQDGHGGRQGATSALSVCCSSSSGRRVLRSSSRVVAASMGNQKAVRVVERMDRPSQTARRGLVCAREGEGGE